MKGFQLSKNGDFHAKNVSGLGSAGKKDSSSDVIKTKSGQVVKSAYRPDALYY